MTIIIALTLAPKLNKATKNASEVSSETPLVLSSKDKLLLKHRELSDILKYTPIRKENERIEVLATAYCPCEECSCGYGNHTSTGAIAQANHTIAVDPSVIPYGTKIKYNGIVYVAEDCGGAVKGYHIDIYMENHSETEAWGMKYIEVEILK